MTKFEFPKITMAVSTANKIPPKMEENCSMDFLIRTFVAFFTFNKFNVKEGKVLVEILAIENLQMDVNEMKKYTNILKRTIYIFISILGLSFLGFLNT
jgi:wyosine [tRNA(Phe)-imidazoG37] synthetase (radical SAM superfamily)